ncbi:glycosyltransferase family 4 protein [Kineococcus sp. LSe6-4]|uniref:Glycosyltransferase family 4 protein n=1 Tax=Kineococcus halophytocola TaxID=3234027 RepID=A0ABV4GXR3_9ACTN
MSRRPRRVLLVHPGAGLYGSDRMLLEAVRAVVADGSRALLLVGEDGPLVGLARAAGARVLVRPAPVLRKSALSARGVLALAGRCAVAAVRDGALLRRLRPDVVYVSTLTLPTWVLLARAHGVPVLCHVHEAESGAAAPVRRALAAPLLAADRLLVNSEYSLAVLADSWPGLAARAAVLPNGVAGPAAPVPARTGAGPLRLLYVGRLSRRKGVLVALDAVAAVLAGGLDAHLDLVGDVFGEHAGFARELEDRLGAEVFAGRVTRHGFDPDVFAHLARADVLLVPSVLPEPFGNTAVEGVLAGRPVLVSDVGGLPEAVAGVPSARLVPAGDAPALARAVVQVAADLAELRASAAAQAPVAAARFAPERYRAGLVAGLEQTLPVGAR